MVDVLDLLDNLAILTTSDHLNISFLLATKDMLLSESFSNLNMNNLEAG